MFERIKQFIRAVRTAMIPANKIEELTGAAPLYDSVMQTHIALWRNMYMDNAEWLGKHGNRTVQSCGLPAAICRAVARPATIESTITVEGGTRAAYLNGSVQGMLPHIRTDVEKGLSVGGFFYKPFVDGNRILVDFNTVGTAYPVSVDPNGEITSAVFSDTKREKNRYYTKLEFHELKNGTYTIRNRAFVSDQNGNIGNEVALGTVSGWEQITPEIHIQNVDRPLFGFFKVPMANNIEPESPLGVSIYSGAAVGLIQSADEQWERLMWEFESGERRILMSDSAIPPQIFDESGLPHVNPLLRDRLFRHMPFGDEDFYQAFSPEFRNDSLYKGFQDTLKLIELNCGLSFGTLSDPQTVNATATEIVSSKQTMYVTVRDTQAALEHALNGLLYGMDVYATLYGLAPAGDWTLKCDWGDGVVQDTESKQKELADMRNDVSAGLIRGELYIAKKYGVTEEEAKTMMPTVEKLMREE